MLLGAAAFAAVRTTARGSGRQLSKSGHVKIKNSRGSKAIFGMRVMMPGDSASGTVNIGNASTKVSARFYLGLSRLIELRGTGGGRLSSRLVLTVQRLSSSRRPQTLYGGPLRLMPLINLGKFRRKETRTYLFTVYFPEGSNALDDRFQAGDVNLRFTWYARQTR
jgi:hypothetical protein